MYQNPVYQKDFPDPFVFKFNNEYWAICTGLGADGGAFGLLFSRDLISWDERGSALRLLPLPDASCYWAPEINYENGKFYLYYSVGNEEFMEIRVAVADSPSGEYLDSGNVLTNEKFAIDAHVFVDTEGTRWLFYATDFLDHAQIGTGTVRDKMLSPFKLAGNPQPVTRALYDWQVYDPRRASKGGVRWHTIEGPSVLKRKGYYYQMFSGGNWQNISYGVSYAMTKDINSLEEWSQSADGEQVLPILRTIPEKVIGPGHNSIVRGPDNKQLYCVYHRWATDLSGRQMAVDPLDFAGEKMLVIGPSYESQFAPNMPTFQDFFDLPTASGLDSKWEQHKAEQWVVRDGVALSKSAAQNAAVVCPVKSNYFLAEFSAKAIDDRNQNCGYGFNLLLEETVALRCLILPQTGQVELFEQNEIKRTFELPGEFEPSVFHLWRVEVDNRNVCLQLDEANFQFEKQLKLAPQQIGLISQNCAAAFAGFALTEGFEDLFDWGEKDLEARGWQTKNADLNAWQIQENYLQCNSSEGNSVILKNVSLASFELIVNARLERQATPQGSYGFIIQHEKTDSEILLTIERLEATYFLQVTDSNQNFKFQLPASFDLFEFQQFRFRLDNRQLQLMHEAAILGEIEVKSETPRQVGLLASQATAIIDMVRVTSLPAN